MKNLNIKTGVSMSTIENTRKRRPKKLGKSCKYCYHYMPGYCMDFGIDISSTSNAQKCKKYLPKGSISPDYQTTPIQQPIKNKITLSVTEFIQFTSLPFSESEVREMTLKNKTDKLKRRGKIQFNAAKSIGKQNPKLIMKSKELDIIVWFEE